MQQVEQAIFALGRNDGAGYQVVAHSPGICQPDLHELVAWGPSHDSLLDAGPDGGSLNFHPLPSGAYCISRTMAEGWECHGGRQRVKTHCLSAPRQLLARFGNNPFALDQAAAAEGVWQTDGAASSRLSPVTIGGGAAVVDQSLLTSLAADPGPDTMAALVQSASQSVCLAVVGGQQSAALIAGLLNCLPPECRLEYSFSTGLKFSPRRPFRLLTLGDDPARRQWLAQYANVAVFDAQAADLKAMPFDAWTQFIHRALGNGQIAFLAAELSKRRFNLTAEDLNALGLQLLEALDASELGRLSLPMETEAMDRPATRSAHGAHRRFVGNRQPSEATSAASVSCLDGSSPEVLAGLERLDDLVYDAINGEAGAMEQLRAAWPQLAEKLDEQPLAESREQYLRYALSIWEQCTTADGLRHPARAIQALEVLCLLFGDAM